MVQMMGRTEPQSGSSLLETSGDEPPPSAFRHGVRPWMSAFVAAVVGMAALLFGYATWRDYHDTLAGGWGAARYAARVLEEQVDFAFYASDLVMDRLIDQVRFYGLDRFRTPEGWKALATVADGVPQIGSVWVLDDEGWLVASSIEPTPQAANFSDREYYVPLRNGAERHITGLLFGRVSKVWFWSINRPIVIDGRFRGIVQTSMHAAYFQQFYEALNLGPGTSINLYRRDGRLVMHWPLRESDSGLNAEQTPLFQDHLPRASEGTYEERTEDGIRMTAYRSLAQRPIVVTATFARSQVLAPFWDRLTRNSALFTLALVVIGALTVAALKALRGETEAARLEHRMRRSLSEALADRERLLDSLQESEQRGRLAREAGGVGLWDWDVQADRITRTGDVYRIWGFEDPMVPTNAAGLLQRVHPDDRERLKAAIAAVLAGEKPFAEEFRVLAPDGTEYWLSGRGEVIRDAEGRPIRITGTNIDVTAARRMADALAEANLALEQRVEMRTREREAALAQLHEVQKMETLGQLTGSAAHDFNNLLAAIISNCDLMRSRLPDGDPVLMRYLDGALQAAACGTALTQRLLAFARRQKLEPQCVSVGALVAGLMPLVERSVGPTVRIAATIDPATRPAIVDPHQLEMALLNLALNARDAMPDGGTLTLEVGDERHGTAPVPGLPAGDYVRIVVSDSGPGMDEATLKRAVEPFFTTKGPGKGTGLGLSMVHGLAAQSGGVLQLASPPGAGVTATIWLPAAAAAVAVTVVEPPRDEGTAAVAPPVVITDPADRAAAPATGAPVVMVVDDDLLIRISSAQSLRDLGFDVLEASSGEGALALLSGGAAVDCVVTDYAMPGMNGVVLARKIRELRPGLPVILVTGFGDLPDGSDLALPRLPKPYRLRQLADCIHQVLKVP